MSELEQGTQKFIELVKAIDSEVAVVIPTTPTINYRRVTMALSTHSAGGLTSNDFDLAKKIDGVSTGSTSG